MHKNTKNQTSEPSLINLFPVKDKQAGISYTGKDISSDGGLLLLKEVGNQIGIIKGLSNCIVYERDRRGLFYRSFFFRRSGSTGNLRRCERYRKAYPEAPAGCGRSIGTGFG